MKKILIFMIIFIFGNIFSGNVFASSGQVESVKCTWKECITTSNFVIEVKNIVPGWTFSSSKSIESRMNDGILTIIQKLMIPFWILAVLVMSIWAWFIVLHNWQDELLDKWKRIFKMWIFSICLALSSYLIIELVKYIVYA